MARAIWKGGISFGLVYVPVQVYPATRTQHTGFNLLEKHSIAPIGYKQINKRTGKEVARENIVRGFEYEKGRYVVLTDEEIQAASPESTQTVDILSFVDASEVSFVYLDTPYYLAPRREDLRIAARCARGHRQDRHRERRAAQQAASGGADSGRTHARAQYAALVR
jgi:DNA end-binding protein Ku